MRPPIVFASLVTVIVLTGCASTSTQPASDQMAFRRTDKLEKVWIADGFDFSGYDTLLFQPVKAAVTVKNEKEQERLDLLRHTLTKDLATTLEFRNLVPKFVTKDTELPPNGRALRLDNEVTEFSAGSMAVRVMVGMGAGTPRLRVRGQLSDLATGKPVVIYELDETAPILGAGWSSSRSLQTTAGSELAHDVADFLHRVATRQPIKYK